MYVRDFFDELFRLKWDDLCITGIVLAPAMGKRTITALIAQMWNFYGPLDFARAGIRYVAIRIASRLPKPLRFGHCFTIDQLANANGLPVLYVKDLNDPDFVRTVRQNSTDVVVSVAAPQIIKADLIRAPKMGCINIHNGTLPKYRGMLPNFWQLYDGNSAVGTTVHRITEGIDDGPILLQDETKLSTNESLHSIIKRTKRKGAGMVLTVLRQLRDGTVVERENRKADGSYHSFPSRADVAEFRRRGNKLL